MVQISHLSTLGYLLTVPEKPCHEDLKIENNFAKCRSNQKIQCFKF